MGILSTIADWSTDVGAYGTAGMESGAQAIFGDGIISGAARGISGAANAAEAMADLFASDKSITVAAVGALTDVAVTEFLKSQGVGPIKATMMGDSAQFLAEEVAQWIGDKIFTPDEAEKMPYGEGREKAKEHYQQQELQQQQGEPVSLQEGEYRSGQDLMVKGLLACTGLGLPVTAAWMIRDAWLDITEGKEAIAMPPQDQNAIAQHGIPAPGVAGAALNVVGVKNPETGRIEAISQQELLEAVRGMEPVAANNQVDLGELSPGTVRGADFQRASQGERGLAG